MPDTQRPAKSRLWPAGLAMVVAVILIAVLMSRGGCESKPVAPVAQQTPSTAPVTTQRAPIKVGWLVSQYLANSQDYGNGYTAHVTAIRKRFLDPEIDLYALVEPDSVNSAAQQQVIAHNFKLNHTVVVTDPQALAKMDVIVISRAFHLRQDVAESIDGAVKNGAGLLIHVGLKRWEEATAADEDLMQMNDPMGFWTREKVPCQVVADHPLLSGIKTMLPEGKLEIANLNGTMGVMHATPLIVATDLSLNNYQERTTAGTRPAREFCPMYIATLGKGRIVNCQWDSIPQPLVDASKGRFYIHCCEYLAGWGIQ